MTGRATSRNMTEVLEELVKRDGPQAYVTVTAVHREFTLPRNLAAQEIPGLQCCQIIVDEHHSTCLCAVWQSKTHCDTGTLLLGNILGLSGVQVFKCEGHQGQFWQRSKQLSWLQYIRTWDFFVNALAVFGVVSGLATHFESITIWAFTYPRTGVIGKDTILTLVEKQTSTQTTVLRNDAERGTSRLEVRHAYLVADNSQSRPKSNATTARLAKTPLAISSSTKFHSVGHGETVDVIVDLPPLNPGTYNMILDVESDSGIFWRAFKVGNRELNARRIKVVPFLDVRPLVLNYTRIASNPKRYQAAVDLQVIPGVSSSGLSGTVMLQHDRVRIRTMAGADSEQMSFSADTIDTTGLMWRSRNRRKAGDSLWLHIVMESNAREDWNDVIKKVLVSIPVLDEGS